MLFTKKSFLKSAAHIPFKVLVEDESTIGIGDAVLDDVGGQIRKVTLAFLTSPAEEVLVNGAAPPFRLGVNNAALPAKLEALAAVQHALKEVIVNAVPCAGATP